MIGYLKIIYLLKKQGLYTIQRLSFAKILF